MRCEEPGCKAQSEIIWRGRPMCNPCRKKYNEEWDRIYMDCYD